MPEDHLEPHDPPTPAEVVVAIEVLLRAGFVEQAVDVMCGTFMSRHELRDALMGAMPK